MVNLENYSIGAHSPHVDRGNGPLPIRRKKDRGRLPFPLSVVLSPGHMPFGRDGSSSVHYNDSADRFYVNLEVHLHR